MRRKCYVFLAHKKNIYYLYNKQDQQQIYSSFATIVLQCNTVIPLFKLKKFVYNLELKKSSLLI